MQPHQTSVNNTARFINIRKLAALDMAFNGYKLILAEFLAGMVLCSIFGVYLLLAPLFTHQPSPAWLLLLGIVLLSSGINYLPLFLYALDIFHKKSAHEETVEERDQPRIYRRKYSVQQLLILVPLAIVILALVQEQRKRAQK